MAHDHSAGALPLSETTPASVAPAGDLYRQIGQLTRQLHDTLGQLGVMPRLQQAAHGLPDARSRLNYVAEKTADAAHRVLNAVDAAKDEQRRLQVRSSELIRAASASASGLVPATAVLDYVHEVQTHAGLLDGHLTDIMMAQDFHDLTGQVVKRVLDVANELEDGLVRLLLQASQDSQALAGEEGGAAQSEPSLSPSPSTGAAPDGHAADAGAAPLQGPVVAGVRQGDVVSSQTEVDDLLASLGF